MCASVAVARMLVSSKKKRARALATARRVFQYQTIDNKQPVQELRPTAPRAATAVPPAACPPLERPLPLGRGGQPSVVLRSRGRRRGFTRGSHHMIGRACILVQVLPGFGLHGFFNPPVPSCCFSFMTSRALPCERSLRVFVLKARRPAAQEAES